MIHVNVMTKTMMKRRQLSLFNTTNKKDYYYDDKIYNYSYNPRDGTIIAYLYLGF